MFEISVPLTHKTWKISAAVLAVGLMFGAAAHAGQLDLNLDAKFGLPTPPWHLNAQYNPTNMLLTTWGLVLIGMMAVLSGVRDFVKTKSLLPVAIALSGILVCIPEVFFDVMGGVFYPTRAENILYTILGRPMEWFMVAAWFGFGGLFTYICFKLIDSESSTRTIWIAFLIAALGDVVFEELILNIPGIYYYYGNQPLILITKFPWWWIPCNAGGMFLAASIAYRLKQHLQGWRAFSMLLITPMAVAGMYGFIAMPSWIVVNGNYPWLLTQAAGLLTLLFGFFAIALIIKLVLGRDPFSADM